MKNFHLLFWCLVVAIPALGQTHTIDNDTLYIVGYTSDNDVAVNTYYNALTAVEVGWNVLDVQIPDGWEYSFCFPNCYPIGVTQASSSNQNGRKGSAMMKLVNATRSWRLSASISEKQTFA